jgi:aminodeoxyfutalosine synthase
MEQALIDERIERAGLADIAEKVNADVRLSFDDGVRLYNCSDLLSVGSLADRVRRRMHDSVTYFNRNMHLNYSNICALSCKFCAFGQKEDGKKAYRFSLDGIRSRMEAVKNTATTEVHIVGGLDPKLPWDYYLEMLRIVKEVKPDVKIKAFTAIEIDFFSKKFRRSVEQVLNELLEAGLDTMPGGGAEVFSENVRTKLYKSKLDVDGWLRVARTAHSMGIRTNCTLLYGHIESVDDRVAHFCRLRETQDDTGGFQAFIPLAFHPENTELSHLPHTTGFLDLRTTAVARLMLDNIPHIKAYWVMLGTKVAQLAQSFGANDLDGTVTEETIVKMAGGKTRGELTLSELLYLIRDAGYHPVERDSLYNVIREYETHAEEGDWEEKGSSV